MGNDFIDPPQGEGGVQWSSQQDVGETIQTPEVPQPGARSEATPETGTPDEREDCRVNVEETVSSASSQEHIPPQLSSSVDHQLPSPPPSLPSSHFSLSSPIPSLSPTLSSPGNSLSTSPPHPYHRSANISVEELNERAMQDSENNNVDENSNDQQYDRYADYHHEFNHHQVLPDQSVRPRVRRQQNEGDEPDRAYVTYENTFRRRIGNSNLSHRRNLSEDRTYSGATSYDYEDTYNYPPLPDLNSSSGSDRLPNLNSNRNEHFDHPYNCQQRELASAQSRSRWHPLNLRGGGFGPQPPPPCEDLAQGAEHLLINFTYDALQSNHLDVPESFNKQQRMPDYLRAGKELRLMADVFAKTDERKRVLCLAQTVNMKTMTMNNFLLLCSELFKDGITRERIVALFTFVGDVAVHQVRLQGQEFLQLLMQWSLKYLVDNICKWVQDNGGWIVLLNSGASIMFRTAVFVFCVFGSVAAGLFIYKTYKDW
ncbi:uncharacterized protein LOC121867532 [Homarus americanus]|uniref:Bcl-2-like protein 1-like 2 n=1 Tax=Homarus americanus TaxID=6706 RepID=A0A8J5MY56_HOMAM|nr:uncharacterized protein LOC121867532 [Homarus americanus]KAG7168218.1 Bcl-2-like protein 1-like 2 [Homarus americanus]